MEEQNAELLRLKAQDMAMGSEVGTLQTEITVLQAQLDRVGKNSTVVQEHMLKQRTTIDELRQTLSRMRSEKLQVFPFPSLPCSALV